MKPSASLGNLTRLRTADYEPLARQRDKCSDDCDNPTIEFLEAGNPSLRNEARQRQWTGEGVIVGHCVAYMDAVSRPLEALWLTYCSPHGTKSIYCYLRYAKV